MGSERQHAAKTSVEEQAGQHGNVSTLPYAPNHDAVRGNAVLYLTRHQRLHVLEACREAAVRAFRVPVPRVPPPHQLLQQRALALHVEARRNKDATPAQIHATQAPFPALRRAG